MRWWRGDSSGRRRAGPRLALVIAGFCAFALQASSAPVQPMQLISAIKPFFYGRALIAFQPADNGTYVDAVLMRGVNDYTVCGTTEVGSNTKLFDVNSLGAGAYVLPIDTTAQCLNPQNRYTLFVNSVNATSRPNPGFSVGGGTSRVDLNVGPVALVTNGPSNTSGKSAPVVYFYGVVTNSRGPVRGGTVVSVKSEDGKCSDTGRTRDLYWQPKAAPNQPVGFLGFYYVAIIDKSGACADRGERYVFYVGGVQVTTRPVFTPPYAEETQVNLYSALAP